MECVASEFVFDFELERPSSAKSLEMQYILLMTVNLFPYLQMVTTAKHKIFVIWFKDKENTASVFTIFLPSSYKFFLFLGIPKVMHIHLRDLLCLKIPENIKKRKIRNIHSPVPDTIQYRVEGQQKNSNNINVQKKEEKTDTAQTWQAHSKESVVILRLGKMQHEDLSLILPNAGHFKQYIFLLLIN